VEGEVAAAWPRPLSALCATELVDRIAFDTASAPDKHVECPPADVADVCDSVVLVGEALDRG
jgi:hypothetical protein